VHKGEFLSFCFERILHHSGAEYNESSFEIGLEMHEKLRYHRHTHVFVSAPTQGYGLYVDWMLQESEHS